MEYIFLEDFDKQKHVRSTIILVQELTRKTDSNEAQTIYFKYQGQTDKFHQ